MENINVLELNYSYPSNRNYTAYQMILPLDLEKKIDFSDPVYSFLEVMEGVNWNKYLNLPTHRGREEYNPFKMIKVILFAFMNQIYSLREIEKACKTDIRFMFLMQEETPSHMAFHRFIQNYLKEDIASIFKELFESIETLDKTGHGELDVNKSGKGKHISMETLIKICETLNCGILDVIELEEDEIE